MASPKTKPRTTPKTATSRATRSAYSKPAAQRSTAQDSAAAWKQQQQQAAKLYQLPFNAEEMTQATQKVAANATEMWRGMWNNKNQQWGDFFANAQKFHGFDAGKAAEKMNFFSRESGSQFARSASSSAVLLNEMFDLARENTEALVEASNQTVAVSKELSAELINFANRAFAQNVELSKEVLTCRTLNDMFDLAGRFMKTNLDGFFSQSVHVSEVLFEQTTAIAEPLNERLTETSERLTKAMSA